MLENGKLDQSTLENYPRYNARSILSFFHPKKGKQKETQVK